MNGDHVQYIDREEANRRLRESVVQSYDTRKRTLDYTLTISWQRVAGYDYTGPQPGAFELCWNAVHLSAKTRHRLNTFVLRFKN